MKSPAEVGQIAEYLITTYCSAAGTEKEPTPITCEQIQEQMTGGGWPLTRPMWSHSVVADPC